MGKKGQEEEKKGKMGNKRVRPTKAESAAMKHSASHRTGSLVS